MPPVREQLDPSTPSLQPVGQHQGQQPLALGRLITLIGSAPSARLYLPSKAVSRCHAAVINTGGVVFIRDLASRTRTRVNGRSVKEAELGDGDVIEVAKFAFRFTRPGGAVSPPPPRPPLPSAALEVEDLDDPISLDTRVLLIGRRETADISLIENAASSAHALVLVADGKHLVRDLNSRTGTFVNGVKVHEHVLTPGDVIRVGETSFRYIQTAGATPRPTERPAVETPAAVAGDAPDAQPRQTDAATADDLITVDVAPELPVEPPAAEDRLLADSASNDSAVGVMEMAEAEREPDGPAPSDTAAAETIELAPEASAGEIEPASEDHDVEEAPAPAAAAPLDDFEVAPSEDELESAATPTDVFDSGPSQRSDFVYEGFHNVPVDDSTPDLSPATKPGQPSPPHRQPPPGAAPPATGKHRRWSEGAASKSDKPRPLDVVDVLSDIDDLDPLPLRPPPTPPGPPPAPGGRE